jgi:murein DD-endopeptidase MepM/ murein hydrolase activator NlpD
MKRIVQELQRFGLRLVLTGMAAIILSMVAPRWLDDAGPLLAALGAGGILLILVGVGALFVPGTDHTGEPRPIRPPVQGRWLALNSPATKVPSHGTRAYGQAYAVDLVFEPDDAARPQFGSGPGMRPAADFPAFGEPVLSPIAGTVVRVRDGARDHRSRSRLWAVAYMMVEGVFRELGGVRNIVGNHVVIDAGDGCFALVAHLQRGSAQVRAGDQVEAGQVLARCGNSGNSSEPHVHVQLMDRATPATARGLPMTFADVAIGGAPTAAGVPANGEHMTAV